MASEFFLSLAKPDAIERQMVGDIIHRFEKRGLQLVDMKWLRMTEPQIRLMYDDKQTQGFFPELLAFLLSGPVVAEASLIIGARLLDDDMPRPIPGQALPRFLRLQYVTVGTHTAGAVIGTMVLDRHDLPEQANAVLGGYPPGIVIAN